MGFKAFIKAFLGLFNGLFLSNFGALKSFSYLSGFFNFRILHMNVFSSTKCNKKMIEFLFLFIGFFSNNVYLNSKYFFYLALNMYDFSICSGNSFVVFARKKKTQKCKMEKRNEMKRNIICFFFLGSTNARQTNFSGKLYDKCRYVNLNRKCFSNLILLNKNDYYD